MAVLGTLGATGAQAARFVVNTTADGSDTDSPAGPYDGVCDAGTADGNQCTLRAAIEEANNNGEPDSITIPAEFTIRLTLGELQIQPDSGNEVQILGSGGGVTGPDGSTSDFKTTVNGNNQSRVLAVERGAEAEISILEITGGSASTGGGILSEGTLRLVNVTVTGNTADFGGGGIYNDGGTVDLDNSAVTRNSSDSNGGGILSTGTTGTVGVNGSNVANNTADFGGGIYNSGPKTVTLNSSTARDNTANEQGGGIYNLGPATTKLSNSTVSGNVAEDVSGFGGGGGIFNEFGGVVSVEHTTITENTAPEGRGSGVLGRAVQQGSSSTEVGASIIAGNENSDVDYIPASGGEPNPFTSNGYNVIGDGNAIDAFDSDPANPDPGDRDWVGVDDPGLGPLAANGGPTQTHALLAGSPAIDNVAEGECPPPETDQRGFIRPQDGDTDGMLLCDSGSYETQVALKITPDTNDFGSRQAGTRGAQTFTIENTGEAPLRIDRTSLAGTNDSQFTLNSNQCRGSTLDVGQQCTLEVVFAPTSEGAKSAQLVVESNAASSPDRVALSGTATPSPQPPPTKKANLSLEKRASKAPPTVGQKLTYTLKVRNNGPDRAANTKIVDSLPKGVKLTSKSSGCNKQSQRKVVCNIGTLSDGQSVTKKLRVKVNRSGKLVNKARASSSVRDPNPKNNSARAVVRAKPKAKATPRFKQISCKVENPSLRLAQGKQVVVADTKPGKSVACVIQGNQLALAKALKNRNLGLVRQGNKQVRAAKGKVVKVGARKVAVRVPRAF
ncbi:MAG: choice-of-anchor D domain-containing protein [Rubrobacteraceae bacterium]